MISDKNRLPISNVNISLAYNNHGAVSKSDGTFIITRIPDGIRTVHLSHVGYYDVNIKDISITPGDTTDLGNIIMEPRISELQPTVITASRQEQKRFDVPVSMNIVDRKTINIREPKTTAEILREESGIFIQKTNHGGGSAIVRGMSSNQILILVDGIRLNNATYRLGNHQYLTTVDHNLIEQIEVIHGPTSVLYGSDALGGVINLRSGEPEFQNEDYKIHYSLFGRYASADKEKSTHGRLSYINTNLSLHAGMSIKNFGDLNRGKWNPYNHRVAVPKKTKQEPSGYTAYDWDVRADYQPADNHIVSFVHQSARQTDVPRYDKYENNDYNLWLYTPQNRDLSYIRYQVKNPFLYLNKFSISVSRHVQEEARRTQKLAGQSIFDDWSRVVSHSFILQAMTALNYHMINSGLEIYLDEIESRSQLEDPVTGVISILPVSRYPDGSDYNSFGFYLRDDIALSKKISLIPGVRVTHINTTYQVIADSTSALNQTKMKSTFNAFTSSINLHYKVNSLLRINLNLGQGFRAPNISDFSKFGQSKGTTFEIPNPNLEPEKMNTIDLTTKVETSNLQYSLSLFYNYVDDIIVSAVDQFNGSSSIAWNGDTLKIKSKQNIGKAYITGFETSLMHKLNRNYILRANLAYTYGQNISEKEPVGGIPPLFGLIGLHYQKKSYDLDFYSRFALHQDRLSTDDLDDNRIDTGGTPGWFTLNFRFSYRLFNGFTFRAGLENILDLNYREHGSGINAPGRNIVLSFRLKR